MTSLKSIFGVVIFSVAFAFVEAAVVVYLRHLLGSTEPAIGRDEILFLTPGITFLEPQTAYKIIKDSALLNVERIREAATLGMLASVAFISGKKLTERIAFFFLAFGLWDLFYYLFLRLTINWPQKLTDLDILFLLPTPWVGPVVLPVTISAFFIISSLFILLKKRE